MSCGFSSANHSLSNTDPGLDPAGLADNGGPTETIALLLTSPAINAGDNAVCRTPPVDGVDQRGEPRFNSRDPNCDIGAFEVQFAQPAPAASGAVLLIMLAALAALGWHRVATGPTRPWRLSPLP